MPCCDVYFLFIRDQETFGEGEGRTNSGMSFVIDVSAEANARPPIVGDINNIINTNTAVR